MNTILDKDMECDVGFGKTQLIIKNGIETVTVDIQSGSGGPTVGELEKRYLFWIHSAEEASIFFDAPLFNATFKYRKEDKQWYLIRTGKGFI